MNTLNSLDQHAALIIGISCLILSMIIGKEFKRRKRTDKFIKREDVIKFDNTLMTLDIIGGMSLVYKFSRSFLFSNIFSSIIFSLIFGTFFYFYVYYIDEDKSVPV